MTNALKRIHLRIAIGGVILMVALLLWIFGLSAGAEPRSAERSASGAMPVRFAEGMVHGFLELQTAGGELLAHGDLLQTPRDSAIDSRMTFHFANSVFDERVTFTQRGTFAMQDYHLVQSGPAFAEDLDATLSRSGKYRVKTRSHKNGEENTYDGTVDLPPDTYNGMVITIAKNLGASASETVHIVAFTPKPRVIRLEFAKADRQRVLLGKHEEATQHIVLKPHLGTLLRFFANLKGIAPPDSHVWIVTDQVPAFVRFEGPMYSGPVWRINLTSPSWPK
jgi:hypothetical protein